MSNEQILEVSTVTANLGIEVRTAIAQAAIADNLHHSLSQLEVVNGELVGIPAILSVTTVGIDRTQHTSINSASQLMLKGVTSQRSVIHLDIHLEVLIQTMSL